MATASKRLVALLILAYGSYVAAVVSHVTLWADIAAPVFDLLAAAAIFHAVLSSANRTFRGNFLLTGIAVLLWGVADTLWLACDTFLHTDPDSSIAVAAFYFGTNVFLVAATIYYAFTRMRKWDSMQLVLDSVVFALAILWTAWTLLYGKQLSRLELLLNYSSINSLSVIFDVFLIMIISIWYLSIRKAGLSGHLRSLALSLSLFAFIDLLYYHLYASGLYIPDSYLDVCYMTSFLGITLSIVLFYRRYPVKFVDRNANTNIGHRHKSIFLVFFPLVIMLFARIDLYDIALFASLLLFHEFASGYIQKAINNRLLLSQEQEMNKKLEHLVAEQTQSLKDVNTELQYINSHDPLTGLFNRPYFFEHMETLIRRCAPGDSVVLVIWNIDKLKTINGTYGYAMGDKLLVWYAGQIKAEYGDLGILARLGSDEFALVVKGSYQLDDLIPLASRALNAVREPMRVDEYVFQVTASTGICMYPTCSQDAVTLLKNADIAMHHAKIGPPGQRIVRYIDVDEAIKRKTLLADRLKVARYEQELFLEFQPQFRIADLQLTGMEALLRWNCPDLGQISPTEFIPIAEEENLIIPIGSWVMENAIRQIAKWNTAFHTDLRMGINISPRQLGQVGTLEDMREQVARYGVKYSWLDIEITESVALDNEDDAGKIKQYFSNSGISISIDDFGTGYSSLGYLSILSFDRLKIAKPLIDKITFDESSRKIVTSIVLLAKSLGLITISEGMENKAQFELLRQLGCDQIQGFYLGKPVSAEEFETAFLQPGTETNGGTLCNSPASAS